jgi:hypothetical protein
LQVPSQAAGKPQKELLLMASMADVPHQAWNVRPTRSGHPSTPPWKAFFIPENIPVRLKAGAFFRFDE